MSNRHLTVTHWGAYELESDQTGIRAVRPFAEDPDPSPIGQSLKDVDQSRVARPSIRKSWLEGGPGAATERRGAEPFVEVDWDTALDLTAERLANIVKENGPDSIMGLTSARCTNEDNYIYQKFMRVAIGTNNLDHCARL